MRRHSGALALACVLCLLPSPARASLTAVYVAQTAAGSDDGTSCANAHAVSFFNTSGNWGAGAAQIGSGTTVHLCGTFTGTAGVNMLTTRGSGTAGAGNAITILFETGAKLTAPHWGTAGAFVINHNYLVVDGGLNGLIEATANGTALTYQVISHGLQLGVSGAAVHDVEIKNLTIANMCVRQRDSVNTSCGGVGVKLLAGGGSVLVHDNRIHDVDFAVGFNWSVSAAGDQVYRNTISNMAFGVQGSPCANGISVTGFIIRDNDFSGVDAWEDPNDVFHHDHIHTFTCGGTNGTLDGPQVYNNYFHGDFANHTTAAIYLEHLGATSTVFNNVIAPSAGKTTDANIFRRNGSATSVYNNTIVCASTTAASGVGFLASTSGTVKNNIVVNCLSGINIEDTPSQSGLVIDRNVYFSVSRWAYPTIYTSLAAWKSATGQDANSVITNPSLTETYHLNAGSSAINLGENETALGVIALDVDRDGVARPTSGALWDAGAYEFFVSVGSGGRLPSPPTQLRLLRRLR